jgi:hypothetical protein
VVLNDATPWTVGCIMPAYVHPSLYTYYREEEGSAFIHYMYHTPSVILDDAIRMEGNWIIFNMTQLTHLQD